ncbi:Glycosyl transferases group 1 [compost metagenome]
MRYEAKKILHVAHLTSAHPRYDIRIFHKECVSIARYGHRVSLLVADGRGSERKENVSFVDIGASGSRLRRFFVMPWKMFFKAREIKADIYHFHDSELLIIGYLLRLFGSEVIYDSHEDLPRQILSKYYLPALTRKIISVAMELLEDFVAKRLSGIVAATPHIGKRFEMVNSRVVVANNYPLRSEIEIVSVNQARSRKKICYTGGVTGIRGIREIVTAIEALDVELIVAGPMESPEFERNLKSLPGWSKVQYLGSVSREVVFEVMGSASLGILLYLPEPNHIEAQPNKMFEYMAAGLPVLASKFPLWQNIVEGYGAGVCVDPKDIQAIREAIKVVLADERHLSEMGERGRQAVLEKLNWNFEEIKILDLYSKLKVKKI